MKIFLIRHGESMGNAKGIHQGQTNDFPLSDTGKKQVELLKKRFENIKIDAIYSSDLKRAKETAEIISESKNLKVITDSRLRERDFGVIGEEKELMTAWKNYIQQEIKKGISPREVTPINGESDKDHFTRVASFFEDLKKNHQKDSTFIVVAHGGTNKVVFGVIGHFSLDEMYKTPQGNTCINEIIFEDNKWSVQSLNCTKHLEMDKEIIEEFNKIRDQPLDVIKNRCWEKNTKLKEYFDNKGYKAKCKICSFRWSEQKLPVELIELPHEDLDYHLFLSVKINGLKLIVDASNDSFLPEYNIWDGKTDCKLAVHPLAFIEENMEEIMGKKIHNPNSKNQLEFLNKINVFLEELRKNKEVHN